MRRYIPCKFASALALLLAAALPTRSAHADPLAPASVPSTAKWVMHLNVDAARSTPLWEVIRIRFIVPRQDELRLRARGLEEATGLIFPRDLKDVTLYGTGYDDDSACILLHANFNEARTIAFLRRNPQFSVADYHSHALMSWHDQGRDRLMFGAFARGSIAIIAPNSTAVRLSLDTLDGKSPALKPNSPLLGFNEVPKPAAVAATSAGPHGTPLFWIAGVNISDLPRAQRIESAPFFQQMNDARLGVSVLGDHLNARLVINAKTEKAAQQLATSAEGIKATLGLTAADEQAAPRAKLVAAALQNLTLTTDNHTISGDLNIGINDLDALLEATRPAAAARAATPPPPARGPLAPGRGRGILPRP